MKRFFVLFVAVLFCASVLVVPVFASDPTEYVFEFMPDIALYRDFFFTGEGDVAFYEGRLPEGTYNFFVLSDGVWLPFGASPVTVQYSQEDVQNGFWFCLTKVYLEDGSRYTVMFADTYDLLGASAFALNSLQGSVALDGEIFKLVPVGGSSVSISDYVSSDILSGVLDNVLALVPACLFVVISYLGIRKAVVFLRDVLHAA